MLRRVGEARRLTVRAAGGRDLELLDILDDLVELSAEAR
jgi:hypothetical protein